MKKIVYVLFCIGYLFILTACEISIKDSNDSLNLENMKVEEKYYPKFIDIEDGKNSIKSLVFGSNGWSLYSSANFLFAIAGKYIIRYDIDENKIDYIIDMGISYNEWPNTITFSENGNYLIINSYDFSGELSRNYFLIDLENNAIELILDIYNEKIIDEIIKQKIPHKLKNEINRKNLRFIRDYYNANFTIDFRTKDEKSEEEVAILKKADGKIIELNSLNGFNYCSAYNVFSENKIGIIMPVELGSCELGYYKIIIINIEEDKIEQEYILNNK